MTSNRVVRALFAPAIALALAAAVSALLLVVSGNSVGDILEVVTKQGFTMRSLLLTLNRAAPYYLSAVAVAIGFKMNLFNIGVEGQYRLAALFAAAMGAAVTLPAPIHVLLILLTGIVVGAAWSMIAGVLKATRGVSEVISTIMLNAIALGLAPYLLERFFRAPKANQADFTKTTRLIPASGRLPSLNPVIDKLGITPPQGVSLESFIFVAAAVGVGYYLLVYRTRFGFDLRASGSNPAAATASGIAAKRMIVVTMALSGGIAGLVSLNVLLNETGKYSADVVVRGLGFTGIAIALLGRNHPAGIAFASLLWAFMDILQTPLATADLPKEIVSIMQGVIVLSVVVAYEVVRRLTVRQEAMALARHGSPPDDVEPTVEVAPA